MGISSRITNQLAYKKEWITNQLSKESKKDLVLTMCSIEVGSGYAMFGWHLDWINCFKLAIGASAFSESCSLISSMQAKPTHFLWFLAIVAKQVFSSLTNGGGGLEIPFIAYLVGSSANFQGFRWLE